MRIKIRTALLAVSACVSFHGVAVATDLASSDQSLQQAVDAALAVKGYIQPEQIGDLTENQRANALNQYMLDNQEQLQAQLGVNIIEIQRRAYANIDNNDFQVVPQALAIVDVGLQGRHLAEEARAWIESQNPDQVRMAQAVMGMPATGITDAETLHSAKAFIRSEYNEDFDDLQFVRSYTGMLDLGALFEAANNGELYVPRTPDGAIDLGVLQSAGFDDATIELINLLPTSAEAIELRERDRAGELLTDAERSLAYHTDTQEAQIARQYATDHDFYREVIRMRNDIVENLTLEVEAELRR